MVCSEDFTHPTVLECTGEPPVLRVAILEIATAIEIAAAARVSAAEVATTEIGPAAEPGVRRAGSRIEAAAAGRVVRIERTTM